eukprot:11660-Prymnesium_polylepis.2
MAWTHPNMVCALPPLCRRRQGARGGRAGGPRFGGGRAGRGGGRAGCGGGWGEEEGQEGRKGEEGQEEGLASRGPLRRPPAVAPTGSGGGWAVVCWDAGRCAWMPHVGRCCARGGDQTILRGAQGDEARCGCDDCRAQSAGWAATGNARREAH